jgi:DNA-binding transcriptional ArsR family regulator
MHNPLTTLQELALDIILADYESVPAIEEQVKLLLGNGVSRQQIVDALEVLREARLVDAFVCREADQRFERYRRARLKAGATLWWRATDAGRHAAALNS